MKPLQMCQENDHASPLPTGISIRIENGVVMHLLNVPSSRFQQQVQSQDSSDQSWKFKLKSSNFSMKYQLWIPIKKFKLKPDYKSVLTVNLYSGYMLSEV